MKYLGLVTKNQCSIGKSFINYANSVLYNNIEDAREWILKDFFENLEIMINDKRISGYIKNCKCDKNSCNFCLIYHDSDTSYESNWTILKLEEE